MSLVETGGVELGLKRGLMVLVIVAMADTSRLEGKRRKS